MWQIDETRKYNQEFQEHVNMQIYESNGITGDKLMGIIKYKNAAKRIYIRRKRYGIAATRKQLSV